MPQRSMARFRLFLQPDANSREIQITARCKVNHRFIKVVLLVFLVSFAAGACRSRKKPVEPKVTPPPVAEEMPTTPVRTEPPPEPESEEDRILRGDLDDINREAQNRGWIRDAFFPFDESRLEADARSALDRSAKFLRERPELHLLVEGHCDERGTEQYNLALGDRRANAAREYLVGAGIDAGRIRVVSYGEERPFATGSSESAWAQNRRAHLVLVRPR